MQGLIYALLVARIDVVDAVPDHDPVHLAATLGELGTSHLVARQELRSLVANLRLPMPARAKSVAA